MTVLGSRTLFYRGGVSIGRIGVYNIRSRGGSRKGSIWMESMGIVYIDDIVVYMRCQAIVCLLADSTRSVPMSAEVDE